ncbi:hypothetical protein F8M41_012354 [Gigaspora margarita]|uniref:Uncharacterized protein n=1 Tax=Gigaspora margarita TaxID=4874 RepID=A0A8H4ATB6_GIGMA|nr:hypothetical protein F8M41_012354 [Gigaspora margarita]
MSTNYVLEYLKQTLNPIQNEVYNNTQNHISFAEVLAEERLKWRFRINAILTIVNILITIAIDITLLFSLLIGTLLVIFLDIYVLPPPMAITWIFVGLIFSNIAITYRYTSFEPFYHTKVKFAVTILCMAVTIGHNIAAKLLKIDILNMLILSLNCSVFRIQTLFIILNSITITKVLILNLSSIILCVFLAIILGTFFIPPIISVSWVLIGLMCSNLSLDYIYLSEDNYLINTPGSNFLEQLS